MSLARRTTFVGAILITTGMGFTLVGCSNTGFKGQGGAKQLGLSSQDASPKNPENPSNPDSDPSGLNKSGQNSPDGLEKDQDLKNKGKNGANWFEDFITKDDGFDADDDLNNGGKNDKDSSAQIGTPPSDKGYGEKGKGSTKDQGSDRGHLSCEKKTGIPGASLKIAGNGHDESITIDASKAIYVRGGSNTLKADVKNPTKVDTICLVVTGNLNKVTLNIATTVENLFIITHGNQPEVKVSIAKESKVTLASVLMTGNQGKITFEGEGTHKCRTVTKGNSNTVTCKP